MKNGEIEGVNKSTRKEVRVSGEEMKTGKIR